MARLIPPDSFFGEIAQFLGTELITLKFFVLDYWSFLHLFTGMIFGLFFKLKHWWILLLLFLGWELFEILLSSSVQTAVILFEKETLWNRFYDIFWAMLGFVSVAFFRKNSKITKKFK